MPRRPLESQIARVRQERERKAAELAGLDAELAALLVAQARLVDDVVELSLREHRSSVNTGSEQMQLDNRLAISKGRSAASEDPFFATIRAAKPKGFTLRSLAKRIGEQPSLLSMQRKGDRPIPAERAKLVEALTGWPADKKHWPGGLS